MGEAETVNEVGGRGRKREEEDAIKTFQANVWHGLFDGIAEVSLCRLKKILSNEDKKKKKKKKKSRHNGKQEVEQDKPSLVESLDSGLVIEELSKGKPRGRKAFVGFKVAVRYTGKLMENDKIFYNNMGEGGEPFEFRLAAGETIKGFEIGVVGMRVGDKRRITIPPDLGYGDQGLGGVIPPDSWLVLFLDLATYKKTRGSVAKIKIQIDLTQKRPQQVWMGEKNYVEASTDVLKVYQLQITPLRVTRIQEVSWIKPTTTVVKLNTDGSTLDNPGRMGAGLFLRLNRRVNRLMDQHATAPWKLQTHLDNIKGIVAQLEQATSSTGSTSMTSIVQCQVGDKKAICICSLLPEKQERCLLNLEFEEDHEDITFLVIGSHSVHLSGFFYGESEDCFGDEYASDPYEEGAAEIDSESSDSIKFEDVAEDGDKDGSTDDAFSMYPPSPIPNIEDEDDFSLLESKRKSATSKKSDGIEDKDTHEEALNEKARGTDVDERKGLQRIVCDDTSKTYDYQR
ncbi:Peptidyl-prolyl cis-trans isomerase FKBP53 [Capsicum baccatum]|uniref:peptidylprolyl isomerase n=1 Tax=Capsicum baccatum TaxID=33114 RepID=A0A2G2WTV9_CAPBA|nr:Peptidyl-prolyl cis-trans isomerase FKBP53 [Capsicum baccatum]